MRILYPIRQAIHFGGNVAQNGLMNFDYMPFKEQTKSEKPGIGMIPEMNTETDAQKIVVPLAKGKKKTVMIFGIMLDSNQQEEQRIRQYLRKLTAYYTDEKAGTEGAAWFYVVCGRG